MRCILHQPSTISLTLQVQLLMWFATSKVYSPSSSFWADWIFRLLMLFSNISLCCLMDWSSLPFFIHFTLSSGEPVTLQSRLTGSPTVTFITSGFSVIWGGSTIQSKVNQHSFPTKLRTWQDLTVKITSTGIPCTVRVAKHLSCPASFTTWQVYFPLCVASQAEILRVATLFSNVLSIFGSSKIQLSSFCHCTERVGEPFTIHWNSANLPRTVAVFSILFVNVGGSIGENRWNVKVNYHLLPQKKHMLICNSD